MFVIVKNVEIFVILFLLVYVLEWVQVRIKNDRWMKVGSYGNIQEFRGE